MDTTLIQQKIAETEQSIAQLRESIQQAQIMEMKMRVRLETLQEIFLETPDEAGAPTPEATDGQTEGQAETPEGLRIVSE